MKNFLLTYCTNLHSTKNWQELCQNLAYAASIRSELSLPQMGLGLWLPEQVLEEVEKRKEEFLALLESHHLFLFTLNGFPQENFHAPVVKEKVYRPHWGEKRRYTYTLRLAKLLASALPQDIPYGSISTLPLYWKGEPSSPAQEILIRQLTQMADSLHKLEEDTGKRIVLALEPEPFCALETTQEVVAFFKKLWQNSKKEWLCRYLGVCLDTCHQAIEWERAEETLSLLKKEEIPIYKVQLSNAPEFHPSLHSRSLLEKLEEPRYLHQVIGKEGQRWVDLPELFKEWNSAKHLEALRIHFHIPLFCQEEALGMATTWSYLKETVKRLRKTPYLHWEVETYTWSVLPQSLQLPLVPSLVRELQVALSLLSQEESNLWTEKEKTSK